MENLRYKSYYGSIDYSEEDNCLFGKVIGLKKALISYQGNTVEELRADFVDGVDGYLKHCMEEGIEPEKSFTGVFNVRIPSEIHGKVSDIAKKRGQSLNSFVKQAIEHELERTND